MGKWSSMTVNETLDEGDTKLPGGWRIQWELRLGMIALAEKSQWVNGRHNQIQTFNNYN